MANKELKFPRPEVVPLQSEDTFCFAATSMAILEYYSGKLWPNNQSELAAEHNKSRNQASKKALMFGSPSYILRDYKCYSRSQKLENNKPTPNEIFNIIKKEIEGDRPVVIGINQFHCGVVYGYDDFENGKIYATDPGPGVTRPRCSESFDINDFLFKYREKGKITGLVFTKNGFAEGAAVPVRDTLNEVDALFAELEC